MKRLLILVDKIGRKKEFFTEYITRELSGDFKVVLARFSDLIFKVNGRNVEVAIDETSHKIKDFDLVYFRRAGNTFLSLTGTLAVYLDYLKIRFFDTTFQNIGPAGDKLTSYLKLSLAGLPTIPAYSCWHNKILKKREEIVLALGLPLVAKQLSSQRGRGVLLLKSKEDFKRLNKNFPKEEFLFQKFLKSEEEYRILVLGKTIGVFERKIRTDPNEFRSNIALGAREEFIDIKKIPKEMKDVAIKAAKAMDIQIAGVDIMIDEKGKMWLLEVNRGPGITYDSKFSPELKSLSSFFAKELKRIDDD